MNDINCINKLAESTRIHGYKENSKERIPRNAKNNGKIYPINGYCGQKKSKLKNRAPL